MTASLPKKVILFPNHFHGTHKAKIANWH